MKKLVGILTLALVILVSGSSWAAPAKRGPHPRVGPVVSIFLKLKARFFPPSGRPRTGAVKLPQASSGSSDCISGHEIIPGFGCASY